jgi:predicted transcriptional regulator
MPKTLADKLRAAVQAEIDTGRSLRDIAKAADVTAPVITKFMQGSDIRISTVEALAKAVGVEIITR